MFASVTASAQAQLLALAESYQIPTDQVVFKISAKMRMPSILIWFIEAATSYDDRYDLWTWEGFNFAVERVPSIFLVGVTIDYNKILLDDVRLFAPTKSNADKPVWPRGFVFEDQKYQNTLT
jgi:hypothetical protein